MSGDSAPHRNEGRFYITSEATCVTVTYEDEAGGRRRFQGKLADLSLRGVRIDLDGRIDLGQEVRLRVEVPGESISIDRIAIVRWQQPRDTKSWWTGCELTEPFDREQIERLATAHVLNRRRDPRYEVDQRVQVRTELSNTAYEARLVNYSKGGFRLAFDHPLEFPHERLMLIIPAGEDELTIAARVKWIRETDGRIDAGCAFSDMDGFVHVRDYAEPKRARRIVICSPRVSAVSSWIALAMAITIVLQTSWVMRTQPELAAAIRERWAAWVVQPLRERFQAADQATEAPGADRAG